MSNSKLLQGAIDTISSRIVGCR